MIGRLQGTAPWSGPPHPFVCFADIFSSRNGQPSVCFADISLNKGVTSQGNLSVPVRICNGRFVNRPYVQWDISFNIMFGSGASPHLFTLHYYLFTVGVNDPAKLRFVWVIVGATIGRPLKLQQTFTGEQCSPLRIITSPNSDLVNGELSFTDKRPAVNNRRS